MDHTRILVTPTTQLTNAGATSLGEFGAQIHLQYQRIFATDQPAKRSASLFNKSFLKESEAEFYAQYVTDTMKNLNYTGDTITLPPLIIRSDSCSTIKVPHVIIVAHKNGPMIPVIVSTPEQEECTSLHNILSRIYAMDSTSYVNPDNFLTVMQNE